MSEQFIGEVLRAGQVTIPEHVRDVLKLCQGDKVRIIVEKISLEA